MKRTALRQLAMCGALGLSACAGDDAALPELSGQHSPIIYGADDRKDFFEIDDEVLRNLTVSSVVALVPHNRLARPQTGGVNVTAPLLGEMKFATERDKVYPLCESEPFRDQPGAADCTGVLIDDDVVLTAGHCFDDDENCTSFAYVFDYFQRSADELEPLSSNDVFACRELLARNVSAQGAASQVDFAVVRLDRPALTRTPVKLRLTDLKVDEPLISIGYPSGLPAKIDQGARVIDTRAAMHDYFLLNSDTFAGSSGSGIFDATGSLVGVLVRGGYDFVLSASEKECVVSSVVSDEPGAMHDWEEATYAKQALAALCDGGYPSQRLCRVKARCGDDYCDLDEDANSCAKDCADDEGKTPDEQMIGDPVDPDGDDAGVVEPEDAGSDTHVKKLKKSGKCSASPYGRDRPAVLTLLAGACALLLRRARRI